MSNEEEKLGHILESLDRIERKIDVLSCLKGKRCPVKER